MFQWPNGNQYDSRGGSSTFRKEFNNNTQKIRNWNNVKYVAFGINGDSYFGVEHTHYRRGSCGPLREAIHFACEEHRGVCVCPIGYSRFHDAYLCISWLPSLPGPVIVGS